MQAPRPVRGGTCGIFAPSSPFPPERFEAGKAVITRLGLSIHEHPQVHQSAGYLAGSDEARLAALHDLLDDPGIDVIWAARGGYGLHRLADRIDRQRLLRANKPIVGFSDICVLHALLQRQDQLSVHGPVVTQLADLGDSTLESLRAVLAGELDGLTYAADGEVVTPGAAEGRLIGGCLSVLAPLVGTPFLPSFDGAILLLEDVGEATYRIDRLLTHLRLAGLLSRVAGVALGDFAGCLPRREGEATIAEVVRDRLGDLGVPVLSGLPFGHGQRNLAVPLGARVRLDASARRLEVLGV